ncbi:MAG: plasmid replication protein, CyRepA1 family, partial [Devosia sp.]
GVTFVRSPKGSGKSQRLKDLLSDSKSSVLLVGHRTSLIRELSRRLDLSFYQDTRFDPNRLGVCLDSIRKVPQKEYDFIVLDESEQVLAHFLSSTMAERRRSAVLHLRYLLARAKHVIALDADLSWISYRFLGGLDEEGPPLHVMINQYVPEPSKLRLLASKNALVHDFLQAVAHGRRSFLTSNSKADVEEIAILLKNQCPTANTLVISSDTPRAVVSNFTSDVQSAVMKYDAILTTPTLSTGIDISFPNDECLIKEVYGLFVPNITTHFECDQQLARVRNPERVSVFIAGSDNAETDPTVVREELKIGPLLDALISDYSISGDISIDDANPLLNLAVDVEVVRRASLNSLRANFIAHRTLLNTEVEEIVSTPTEIETVGDWLKDVKEQSEQVRIAKLLSAGRMTVAEYDAKERSPDLSEGERYSLQRFDLETFYRRPLTASLLALDDNGRLQERLPIYGLVVSGNFPAVILYAVSLEASEDDFRTPHAVQAAKASFLQRAFLAAGVLKPVALAEVGIFLGYAFDPDAVLKKHDLGPMVQYLKDKAGLFKSVFGRSLRKNFETDPITQVQSLLGEVGLELLSQGGGKEKGKKVNRYRLDREKLSFIQGVSDARSAIDWKPFMEGLASEYDDNNKTS